MVTVSVVIPTYNRADVISRAIDSILNQTYKDFEIIVVDDGSTDYTEDVIDSYSDNRLQYIKFDGNNGANAARNEGIKQADGKYISFLDSDDEFTNKHLEKVISTLSKSDSKIKGVYVSQVTIEHGEEQFSSSASEILSDPIQVIENYPANGFSSFTFDKKVFKKVGSLDEGLKAFQDREFLIRYLSMYNLLPISDELVLYHTTGDRISSDPGRKISALEVLVEKHNKKIETSNSAFLHYTRGHLYAKKQDMNSARKHFFSASKGEPTSLKYHLHTISSLIGYNGYLFIQKLKEYIKYMGS